MRHMTYKSSRLIFLLLICIVVVSSLGCSGIRSSLDRIDASYRSEFYDGVVPQNDDSADFERSGLFVETLDLIDQYIRDYKDKGRDPEIAHVKVLQSLIYLQKREFQKARLAIALAKDYKNSAEERDRVLIDSLDNIIWGWQESERARNPSDRDFENSSKEEILQKSLRTLDAALEELDKINYDTIFGRKNTGEEIYLYLTAARSILHHNRAFIIGEYGYQEYSRDFNEDAGKQVKSDYSIAVKQMETVLENYLPDNELVILKNIMFDNEEISFEWFKGESRFFRYKALYVFLRKKELKFNSD